MVGWERPREEGDNGRGAGNGVQGEGEVGRGVHGKRGEAAARSIVGRGVMVEPGNREVGMGHGRFQWWGKGRVRCGGERGWAGRG